MTVLARFLPFFLNSGRLILFNSFLEDSRSHSWLKRTYTAIEIQSVKLVFFSGFYLFFHLFHLSICYCCMRSQSDTIIGMICIMMTRERFECGERESLLSKPFAGLPVRTYRQIQLGRRPVGNRIYRPPAIPGRQVAHINGLLPKCILHNNNWVRNIRSIVGR